MRLVLKLCKAQHALGSWKNTWVNRSVTLFANHQQNTGLSWNILAQRHLSSSNHSGLLMRGHFSTNQFLPDPLVQQIRHNSDAPIWDHQLNSPSTYNVPVPIVDYAYVKKLVAVDYPNIVDVRDPEELRNDGKIPMSINIPLANISEAFACSPKVLSGRYNLEVNSYDDEIIFHCRSGVRSNSACVLARDAGYKNVKNYKGSILEWNEKNPKPLF